MSWSIAYQPPVISAGSAPSWFASLAQFPTWTQVAKGSGSGFSSGGTMSPIIQSPNSSSPAGSWGLNNGIVSAYTGMAVSQTRKEAIIAAGGGHGDGANNSAFALALGDEIPAWRRLTDCTPDAQLGDLTLTHGGIFTDGRPRAMHASNMCWAGGSGITERVWFPMQSSVTSGGGGHADNVLSFNRGDLGAGLTPLAYASAPDIGPWTFWGPSNQNNNTYGFGGCVFDSVHNQLIAAACAGGAFGIWWQKIPVNGVNEGVSTAYNNQVIDVDLTWMQICPDLGIVVMGDGNNNRVAVLDIATNTISVPSQSGTAYAPKTTGNYVGAVYIPGSKSLLIADPKTTGTTYYKLQIPLTGSAYNPAGTFVWTSSTWIGGPTSGNYDGTGSTEYVSSKLNRIEDMDGAGTGMLVLVTSISGPVFVSKIPAAGI